MKTYWLSILLFCISMFCIFMSIFFTTRTEKDPNASREELKKGVYLEKICFDGHTYIFLVNGWNYAGNEFLHDPSCECLNKER